MSRLTILGGYLLPSVMEGPKKGWGLTIEGNTIVALGPNAELRQSYPALDFLDASDKIILPGFVNSHMHLYGLLSHGIPIRVPPRGFYAFLQDFWWPQVEDRLDHDLIRSATALACLTMIRSGITTFCDILEAPRAIPGALEVEAEVVAQSGLRAVLSFEATERMGAENGQLGLEENARFIQEHPRTGCISGMMCLHTTFTCSPPFIQKAKSLATELGSDIHMHLSESSYEPQYCMEKYGVWPVKLYEQLGFLGPDVLASQCVQVRPEEIAILEQQGVRVSHMPLSNCEVGGGISPVPDLLTRNITVGLGSDGYINNFFEVMRGAFLIHKAARQDTLAMPSTAILRMATEWGARAVGLSSVGTLEAGHLADVILIDGDCDTPLTDFNLMDQVVLYRHPTDIDTVIVDGQFLMKNKEVLTLDESKVKAEAQQAATRLWG